MLSVANPPPEFLNIQTALHPSKNVLWNKIIPPELNSVFGPCDQSQSMGGKKFCVGKVADDSHPVINLD